MRGIAGIIRFDQAPVLKEEIGGMIRTMAICSFDRIQHWGEGSAGLAHFVQYFYREDRFEAQPLHSVDGNIVLVTDAILENRAELADALGWRADETVNRPDSAFVLAAYERWGVNCPGHLEGKFVFAAWHRRERRLFCAVDPIGRRPLYYWQANIELAFATTLKGLFALARVSRELNEDVLAAYVTRIDPPDATDTLYRDVSHLPGGHHLTMDARGCRIVRYWNPDPTRVLRLPSDADYLEAFRAELERAVRTSLDRAPRQIGIMISGGLDSAAVTAVAGKILATQGRRLQAFHRVPGENRTAGRLRELDESRFVKALQKHAPHIDFHFLPRRVGTLAPDEWESRFEDDCVPFQQVARGDPSMDQMLDNLDVGTLFNGVGGNYLVSLECPPSGYLTHLFATGRWGKWLRESHGLRQIYGQSWHAIFRASVLSPLKRALMPTPRPTKEDRVFLLSPDVRARTNIEQRVRESAASWNRLPWDFRKLLNRVLTEVAAQHVGVIRSVVQRDSKSRAGAAPMFDRRLNEFCLSLPFDQQIRGGQDRRLLRESMRGLLPEEVRLRITRGFPQPALLQTFRQSQAALQSEFARLGNSGPVLRYLDPTWLRARFSARGSTEEDARALTEGVVLSRFLEWHEKQRPRLSEETGTSKV